MEVSALKYSGGVGLHGRSPLLRLQSDERLVALVRRGNAAAFEALVSRYESRLLAFCRHMLGSREDAEDVLQDVMTAAYNAMLADERPINVRPWLYRIARNRSLNHMRRAQALASDTMDAHLSDHGATTADKVGAREEFRLLVGDIHGLPETQRTALVLREMDALSYEQIAEAMETTVPSVKSLLVRARVSLAEAAEARLLSCEQVRTELGEVAEGLQRRPGPLVRRHLKTCSRCRAFQVQLKATGKALAVVLPIGPVAILKQLALTHLGHSAGGSATATAASSGASAAGGVAGGLAASGGASGFLSAGVGAIATKAAAGLAAAAIVTAGAVEATPTNHHRRHSAVPAAGSGESASAAGSATTAAPAPAQTASAESQVAHKPVHSVRAARHHQPRKAPASLTTPQTTTTPAPATTTATTPAPGRTDTTTVPTVLPPSEAGMSGSGGSSSSQTTTTSTPSSTTTTPTSTTSTSTTPTSTTPTSTTSTSTTTTSTTTTSGTTGGASTAPAPTSTTQTSTTPAG